MAEIKRLTGEVIVADAKAPTVKQALEVAFVANASLENADLAGADLKDSYLEGAQLKFADLEGTRLSGSNLKSSDLEQANLKVANLEGADLKDAVLKGADLTGANFRDTYLKSCNLEGANLTNVNFEGAYFRDCSLRGANLSGAYLRGVFFGGASLEGANLDSVRDDVFSYLDRAPKRVQTLSEAIEKGLIDGTTFEGECVCEFRPVELVSCVHNALDIRPEGERPAEIWFFLLRNGRTPENDQVTAITAGWIQDWLKQNGG